jgi:hypothetical protein
MCRYLKKLFLNMSKTFGECYVEKILATDCKIQNAGFNRCFFLPVDWGHSRLDCHGTKEQFSSG